MYVHRIFEEIGKSFGYPPVLQLEMPVYRVSFK